MTEYFVGLMSGTSMDGIDAVLVSFGDAAVEIHATHSQPYPAPLRDALIEAANTSLDVPLDESGELNRQVGECFRDAACAVISTSGVANTDIIALGSHGQTLRHQPNAEQPFSLQIGDANIIATGTRVTTVANFRAADIQAGGQGAPLVPPFHHWLFGTGERPRAIVNIGGIANVTYLPIDDSDIIGFDTGPGNGLMDAWVRQNLAQPFDENGDWAASGKVINALLDAFLRDDYFQSPPPKSTGFEYFNKKWLERFGIDDSAAADVQTTLCELTAMTISQAIRDHCADADEVFICGGGVRNLELMRRLERNLPETSVMSTAAVGLDPDWVEAVAFAWLAMRTIKGQTGNLPSVTGASHKVVLGDIHSPYS